MDANISLHTLHGRLLKALVNIQHHCNLNLCAKHLNGRTLNMAGRWLDDHEIEGVAVELM